MGLVIGVPIAVALHRIFTCPEGKVFAVKELVANLYLRWIRRSFIRRFDNYDIFSETDAHKVGILYPQEERYIEHRRDTKDSCDNILIYGANPAGDKILVRLSTSGSYATAIVLLELGSSRKEYVLPQEELYRVPRSKEDQFVGGGLRIRCLLPMRKWRIFFNGLLREKRSGNDEHVKFSFLWTATSNVFDATSDIHLKVLSNYLAHQEWEGWLPDSRIYQKYLDKYEQSGNLMGTIIVNQEEEQDLYLWGYRLRSHDTFDSSSLDTETSLFGYTQYGDSFHFEELDIRNKKCRLAYGFLIHSNSFGGAVDTYSKTSGDAIKVTYDKKNYEIQESNSGIITWEFLKSDFNGRKLSFNFCHVLCNEVQGTGLRITSTRQTELVNLPTELEREPGKSQELVISFVETHCKDPDNSGGKGASLARLMQLGCKDNRFEVPKGIVITTAAYEKFIEITNLTSTIRALETVAWGNVDGNIKEQCESAVASISKMKLPEIIKEQISWKLDKTFGHNFSVVRFAVRSSASGEDSEDMSAAGQMDTFLGVSSLENIMEAVVKCWASQFTYTAIQYKRQNGQALNSAMAVVVQEMVAADVAGVLFTCDPLDGNPARLTITANYGIGESVVSATVEPDTLVLKRSSDNEIEPFSEVIGKKHVKMVMKESGGIDEKETTDSENKECCLKHDSPVKLAKIGVWIEKTFGCPLDLEWAMKGERIFLLQARPITTFDQETDFEIAHEQDSFIRCEEDYNSKANTGEVLPGAMSTLGADAIIKIMELSMRVTWIKRNKKAFPYNPYLQRGLVLSQNHVLFGLLDSVLRFHNDKGSMATNAYMVAIFGRILDDPEMLATALRRNKHYPPSSNLIVFYLLKDILCCERDLEKSLEFFKTFQMQYQYSEGDDAQTIFNKISSDILILSQPAGRHGQSTLGSSMLNLVLLSILAAANDGWDDKVYSNFARILSTCKDVESADVPAAIQALALLIQEDICSQKFKDMSTLEALKWLQTFGLKSSEGFEQFLEKHGHRCVKEFDMLTKPWGENPEPVIKTLQEMVGTVKCGSGKDLRDVTSTIPKIPLDWKQRLILKLVVPYCRQIVRLRESSKSLLIKIADKSRKAFNFLGTKMVSEGRLPDPKLIFFLSLNELEELLRTRSPRLIRKAIRRRGMLPQLEKLRFPEIMKGVPHPIQQSKVQVPEGKLCLKGTPVSRGAVRGKARVATTLEEATKIQEGEILIAYSTDIGWSPYFPLLSGVATELGGLISHGAVVAREYGLPCVVGVHGATDVFKTGDDVYLDGNSGQLLRMDPEDVKVQNVI